MGIHISEASFHMCPSGMFFSKVWLRGGGAMCTNWRRRLSINEAWDESNFFSKFQKGEFKPDSSCERRLLNFHSLVSARARCSGVLLGSDEPSGGSPVCSIFCFRLTSRVLRRLIHEFWIEGFFFLIWAVDCRPRLVEKIWLFSSKFVLHQSSPIENRYSNWGARKYSGCFRLENALLLLLTLTLCLGTFTPQTGNVSYFAIAFHLS